MTDVARAANVKQDDPHWWADHVVCICPNCDISPYGTVKGWSRHCAIHGQTGPAPDVYAVRSNVPPEIWAKTEPMRRRWFWWWRR